MVDDQRLMTTEIAIGQPVHEAVAERIELLRGPRLRDADPAVAGLSVGGDGYRRGRRNRAQTRRSPVDMELPARQAARRVEREEIVGGTGRWQPGAIQRG